MCTRLARLARRGELQHVVKDLYHPPGKMTRPAANECELGTPGGEVSAAAFRDATGLGSKRAIQALEYLDRIGVLCRVGEVHRIRVDSNPFTAVATRRRRTWRGNDPGGSAGLQTRWVAPCVAGWVRLPFPSAPKTRAAARSASSTVATDTCRRSASARSLAS
jgi:hypothetical protein